MPEVKMSDGRVKKYTYDKEGMAAAAKARTQQMAKAEPAGNPMNPMSSPPKAA